MFKLFSILMILPVLLCSHLTTKQELFNEVQSIEIYNNGQQVKMTQSDLDDFEKIFCDAIEEARQVPALGVAIDNLVKEDMKEGIWIKFIFEKTFIKSEMPFDELLINVQKNSSGFNIIRGNNGIYDGRCYYLELNSNLDKLYEFIENLSLTENIDSEIELEVQEIKETSLSEEVDIDEDKKDKEKPRKNSVIDIEVSNIDQKNQNSEENSDLGKSQKELLEVLSDNENE